jgi:hypothetical protein
MVKNKFSIKIISKIVISLVIVAISASMVYFFSNQIKKANITIGEKKEMDYLIANREQVNNKIKTDFLSVDSTYQEKINTAIPSVNYILPFVDAMESLEKKYSLKQTLSFGQPTPSTTVNGPVPLMLVTFNLMIEDGNIETFKNYLKDFEKLPYFSSIDSISYQSSGKAGWQENSIINIVGSLYAHQ